MEYTPYKHTKNQQKEIIRKNVTELKEAKKTEKERHGNYKQELLRHLIALTASNSVNF